MDCSTQTTTTSILIGLLLMVGCASEYNSFHNQTGDLILLTRRAYSAESCIQQIREEGQRLGVSFRYVHVKGSDAGLSLLWPVEGGYACEAAIGPEDRPRGIYPREHSPSVARANAASPSP